MIYKFINQNNEDDAIVEEDTTEEESEDKGEGEVEEKDSYCSSCE